MLRTLLSRNIKVQRQTILRYLILPETRIEIVKLNVFLMSISNQHANSVIDLFSKQRKTKETVKFVILFNLEK